MKKIIAKHVYIMATIFFLIGSIFYISVVNRDSQPFDAVQDMRSFVENYELIASYKTKNGTKVYSVGTVNDDSDNMYFVDMVVKSFVGYKWLGGGGHINRGLSIEEEKDFIFSAQLLRDDQHINPTLFGICLDEDITRIAVKTRGQGKFSDSTIYAGKEENEKLYVVSFENDVSDFPYFIFAIIYKDNKRIEYFVQEEKLSELKSGKVVYVYEKDLKSANKGVED